MAYLERKIIIIMRLKEFIKFTFDFVWSLTIIWWLILGILFLFMWGYPHEAALTIDLELLFRVMEASMIFTPFIYAMRKYLERNH